MTTDDLFAAFGGVPEVMAITGARRNAVSNWRAAGVPFRHWPALINAAGARGIAGITFAALTSTQPATKEAA